MLGSRLLGGDPRAQGMPWWKYVSNRFLTGVENRVFGLHLSEYHTGYRAYRREVLESVNVEINSDNFIFDQEIMAQFVEVGTRIAEVPVPTRYFAAGLVGVVPAEHRLRPVDPLAARPLRPAPRRAVAAAPVPEPAPPLRPRHPSHRPELARTENGAAPRGRPDPPVTGGCVRS